MEAFTRMTGVVAPLDRANVDTDAIIPKQFLKSIKRTGFGPYLFDEWRYEDHGEPGMDCSNRPLRDDFILNQAPYKASTILLARQNFGCGSSREHAPWALHDFGFRVVIAPSFADIFYNNAFKNGMLLIRLSEIEIERLFNEVKANLGYKLTIDLEDQTIATPAGEVIRFDIDEFRRHRLLNGLDDIGMTLKQADAIREYEDRRKFEAPWLFGGEE